MKPRLAAMEDLTALKAEYKKMADRMNEEHLSIWDDVYPCEFLEDDIQKKQLYILEEENEMAAAFALCNSSDGEDQVKWENNGARAFYPDRFGVSTDHLRKGVGSAALRQAAALAAEQGAEYLRLFVVDGNAPAINLYQKNGFKKAEGVFYETIDEELTLHELGYELKI